MEVNHVCHRRSHQHLLNCARVDGGEGRCWSRMEGNNVLVVPPFDCAWLMGNELRFAEDGRGCVAFEARADNDVTVVFKEHAGACSIEN